MHSLYVDMLGEIEPFDGLEDLLSQFRKGLAPPPDLTVSQWADQNRVLDKPFTKNRMRWRTEYVPYTREIMDCLSPSSPVKRVAWIKGAQVSGSETGNNWLGFTIAHHPGLLMLVNPTKNMVKRMSRRVQSLIESSGLDKLVLPARSRDSGNTQVMKQFPGGMILFVGANSGVDLRSYACPFLFFDEVDGMPFDVDNEGHPVAVAEARTFGQGEEYKIYLNSTPKIEQTSQIWKEWLGGDQRYYMMRCPNSDLLVHWEVKNLVLEDPDRIDSVRYKCTCGCGGVHIEGLHKTSMMAGGLWVPKAIRENEDVFDRLNIDGDTYELRQFNDMSLERSYWTPATYSPIGMMSWRRIMEQWQKAQGVYSLLKAFRMTVEGLPWKEIGDAPDAEVIWNRRSRVNKMRVVPSEVVMLTAGADIGQDHIEVSVYGWGRRRQRWLIEHIRIDGPYNDKKTWDRLEDILERRYEHASGAIMAIRRMCIDRGKWADVVDAWVNTQNERRVTAIKGYDHLEAPFRWAGQKKQHVDGTQSQRKLSIKWAMVGVSYLKLELLGNLNLPREDEDTFPGGWLHLPVDVTMDWIKQLTGERRVYTTDKKTGVVKAHWEKISDRVEALDCTNYARAAAAMEGWDDWTDVEFQREEQQLRDAAEDRRIKLYEYQQSNGGMGTIFDVIPGLVAPVQPPDFQTPEAGMVALNASSAQQTDAKSIPSATQTDNRMVSTPNPEIGIVGCKPAVKSIPMPNFGSDGEDDD